MGSLVLDGLAQERAESPQVIIIRAGVMLPSMHEHDQDHILSSHWRVVWRERLKPLSYGVHLPPVIASPLVVKLDNGEFVRRAFHEAMKRLVLRIRHDPGRLPGLYRSKTL